MSLENFPSLLGLDPEPLLLPFRFGFMQNAFWIGVIVSGPAALLSCFLVMKGWALMGDAVSHAVLPGIVAAHVVGAPLIVGACIAAMVCAGASGYIARNSRIRHDTAMGVVFSAMFALGIVLHVWIDSGIHLDHILFGNILGVGRRDLSLAGTIGVVVVCALLLKRKDLLLHSFDPVQAQAIGLWGAGLHYGLLAALSLTIVAMLSSVGLILAIGLLIAPGAIAFLLVRRFDAMLLVSVLVCLVAMAVGTYASFFLDSAPAPTIVLVLTGLFVCALARRMVTGR